MNLNKKATDSLIGCQLILQRLMSARIRTTFAKMTVIQAHAPTPVAADKEIKTFYQPLRRLPRHKIIVIAGFFEKGRPRGSESNAWMDTIGNSDRETQWRLPMVGFGERPHRTSN